MKHTPAVLLAIAVSAFAQSGGQFGDYAVVLKDQPVARVVQSRAALSGSPAAAQFQKIQSAQQAVIAELNRRGVRPAGDTDIIECGLCIGRPEHRIGTA
jgi:hypothetical protein